MSNTIVGIAGSWRGGSFNAALLRAAAERTPADWKIDIRSIADIPLYDGDLEREGIPAPVVALKEALAAAQGLLIVSPEYNGSIPGTLKNAIDWCSRPPQDIARVYHGLPVALAGATPGGIGTRMAQSAWLPVFRTLRAQVWSEALYAGAAHTLFDGDGRLTDDAFGERLGRFVARFCEWAGGQPRD